MVLSGRSKKGPKEPHKVVTVGGASPYYEVTSGSSGQVYKCRPTKNAFSCECEGFNRRGWCSHLDAVVEFAKEVVGAQGVVENVTVYPTRETEEILAESEDPSQSDK